ncbi:MAG TPA: hypothetical protein PLE92_04035 [Lentisphaeria bacterium]|nr:hypothetical protein [Lentisphaerota bacterium]OQC11829.1 MAG: hypothetical protein BWX73_03299 [Lentisphaerae bacterium ADurb.Bin082]HQC52277.1 hypothetical protein [Lentisphaeria bacterium]HQL87756.1 hypothetical protein [Lentisphaeria bacterium]
MRFRFRSTPLGSWLAGIIGRLVGDWLYFPNRHYDRPQPIYGPAQAMRAQNKPLEAMEYLNNLSKQYPDLARPYIEMMDIADRDLHDRPTLEAIYRQGCKTVRGEERKALDQAYDEMTR